MKKYILFSCFIFAIMTSCTKENSSTSQPEIVYDIDSNMYHTIKIGSQTWMVENLKTTHYRNGDSIPNIADDSLWSENTIGAYCNYNNDSGNNIQNGRLYNWYAINNPNGLAPVGWHIPSDSEWTILVNTIGGQSLAGGALKAVLSWESPNTGANNSSGFSALPAGGRFENGIFSGIGNYGAFWCATQYDSTNAYYQNVNYNNTQVYTFYYPKLAGFSCRCVKN